MLLEHIDDGNGGVYVAVIYDGKVFLGHETNLSDKGDCAENSKKRKWNNYGDYLEYLKL